MLTSKKRRDIPNKPVRLLFQYPDAKWFTVCHVIFAQCYFCSSTLSTNIEFAQTQLIKREIIWDFRIRPVFNLPTDNVSKRGKNKMGGGGGISLQTILKILCKLYFKIRANPFQFCYLPVWELQREETPFRMFSSFPRISMQHR